MTRVVLDAELRAKLQGATAAVELTDEAGNVLGHFFTHGAYERLLYELAKHAFTREEIDEARREMLEKGGLSTAELLADLAAVKRELESRK